MLLTQLLAIILALPLLSSAQVDGERLTVYERFHIDSIIVARYATTRITSVVLNNAGVSRELSFQVQLPDTAFISNFSMIVNDTTFIGVAEEKRRASEEFDQRQQAGENVGLVESRGTNVFQIRINTAASSMSTFILEYEELLVRQLSKYQQTINLNPGSLVENFRVNVRVIDEQGISYFNASDFVTRTRVSEQEVMFMYAPSVGEQNDQSFGLARDMVIEYDVNHPDDGAGLIIVNDCYFAQFFSPSGVSAIPVDIVFVIDVSGSMSGIKIEQARQSLVAVISQLRTHDRFSIVTFSSIATAWMNRLVDVNEYRQAGVRFSYTLLANGGTNFTGGMQMAIDILKRHGNPEYIQLLVMLTDGEPTVGIIVEEEILSLAKQALVETRISLNTLGFGDNLNFPLLVRLALANRGIAKRIYEGSDAAEQLVGFYEEISSPILHTINVSYPRDSIAEVSDLTFPLLFNGSEIVVAGKFSDDTCSVTDSILVMVSGMGTSGEVTFQSRVNPRETTEVAGVMPSTERLYAYLTIQQMLDAAKVVDNDVAISALKDRALALALQYNFVTELTSLIVVEDPNSRDETGNFTLGGEDGVVNDDGLQERAGAVPFNLPTSNVDAATQGPRPGNVYQGLSSSLSPEALSLNGVLLVLYLGSRLGW